MAAGGSVWQLILLTAGQVFNLPKGSLRRGLCLIFGHRPRFYWRFVKGLDQRQAAYRIAVEIADTDWFFNSDVRGMPVMELSWQRAET